MKWVSLPFLALVLCLPLCDRAVSQTSSTRQQNKQRVNDNVLFLMGGQPGATFNQIANDISVVMGAGNNVRVLSVDGGAAVQNVEDVLFLRNIDMALTTQETLNYLKDTGELGTNLTQKLTYIAALFPNPLQILARSEAISIKDLSGKKSASTTRVVRRRCLYPSYSRLWGSTCRSSTCRKETHWRNSDVAR